MDGMQLLVLNVQKLEFLFMMTKETVVQIKQQYLELDLLRNLTMPEYISVYLSA